MPTRFVPRSILPVTLLAMAIAACLPFDRGLQAITAGHTAPHVALVGAMALAGGWLAPRAGLSLGGRWGDSLRVGLVWALGMTAYVLLIDIVAMRPMMAPGVVAFAHTPLADRLLLFAIRAFNENVIYRLFVFGGVMAALRIWHKGRPAPLAVVLAAGTVAQLVNITLNVVMPATQAITSAELAYWAVRYIAPGVAWAWLYARHGFATAEVASVGTHFVLQPAMTLLI